MGSAETGDLQEFFHGCFAFRILEHDLIIPETTRYTGRQMRLRLIAVFLALALARSAPAQVPAGASVSGQVREAVTLLPVVAEHIVLFTGKKGLDVRTDQEGRYSFSDVPPGSATIMIPFRSEFSRGSGNIHFRVKPGERVVRDILVSRTGTLTGQVSDREDDKPVTGISMVLWDADAPALGPFSNDGTRVDEKGRFELKGLRPGRYYVELAPRPKEYAPGTAGVRTGYGDLFYPGVPRVEMAVPITIGPGEDRRMDWRVEKREL